MHWHWKVRIYNSAGAYGIGQIAVARDLAAIDCIQDFYKALTGHKLLLEGMSEQEFAGVKPIREVFEILWTTTP